MQVRFLLGPAGSGKTFRCLAEIRAALARSPDGPPLVLLAPKQATFQLERQLLGGGHEPNQGAPSTGSASSKTRRRAEAELGAPAHAGISGFTRLQVMSFDRLAEFVFARLNVAPPKLLSAEGRLMVLRALLRRHDGELKLLRGSARRSGFAEELGGQLAELQQQQFGPARLRALAANEALRGELRDKLHDLALLAEKYAEWLRQHELQDANCLLEAATGLLRENRGNIQRSTFNAQHSRGASHPLFNIEHLWLDGFAEMTPQEHALLAAVIPFCQGATLAFCLETEPTPEDSWLSIWSAIGKTFQRCRDQITAVPGCEMRTEKLQRASGDKLSPPLGEAPAPGASPALTRSRGRRDACPTLRFAEGSALGALEEGWVLPVASEFEILDLKSQISVTACANPEAEAVLAAREILKFVRRDGSSRFRDCAVLVRDLEQYYRPVARVFRRYGIPFFLDRRESVAHHPLAELTRSALRTVAGDWQHDDWFAALKAGFTPLPETAIDRLENMALESGWRGKKWREPLPDEGCERTRQKIFPPFDAFYRQLQRRQFTPTGGQLADAIRELWDNLKVDATLEKWGLPEADNAPAVARHTSLHQTVFDQMNAWLENVARAFPREPLPLREWLPILETGLAGLTVGVIPPALDEVLVGAIDRARNPDLKFALVLGVNESVFPAPPAAPAILTLSDREDLDKQNVALGTNVLDQISRERYLGYIACTRASQRLVMTFSRQGADGRALNPSPLVAHLQKHFPQLEIEEFSGEVGWHQAEHVGELFGEILKGGTYEPQKTFNIQHSTPNFQGLPADCQSVQPSSQSLLTSAPTREEWGAVAELPAVKALAEKLRQLREPDEEGNLSPELAEKVYGAVLKSSVSRLEEFAQCPFRFFVHSGLRAEERKKFELDARERGSFQHEILKKFHDELVAEHKRWRDITPAEARERIGRIATSLAPEYREGLLRADDESRFAARTLAAALQDFVETLVAWMRGQYEFDPAKAETGFGMEEPGLPAWKIDLGNGHALALRGRVDRIDLCQDGERSLAVVMDYKSSQRRLDKVLIAHGVQLQLLAYLAAVRRWPAEFFGAKAIVPAGVFYVNLRGQFESGPSRTEVLMDAEAARREAYRHNGRFDATFLEHLDRRRACDQFNYQLNNDGSVRSNSVEALSCKEFTALLDQVEAQLRALGERIYSGEATVDPYRKGSATACDYCDYRAVCRIDEWTHEWRELRAGEKTNA